MMRQRTLTFTTLWLPLLFACGEPAVEGEHLDDQVVPNTSCPVLGISGVVASADDGNVPAGATDNDLATRWSSLGKGSWIEVDLGAVKTVCSTAIAWYRGTERRNTFTISTSQDGASYVAAFSGTSSGTASDHEVYDIPDGPARFVRVTVDGNTRNDWASITELDIAGDDGSPPPPPPPPPTGEYDEFGVKMMLPTDPSRFSWRIGDPNDDDHFRVDGDGSTVVLQPDGSWLFKPRKGNLNSGGTQLTLRLHVSGTTASESFSNHAELRRRGHMTDDPMRELGDQEMTGYFRLTDIEAADDTISKKIRGGRHSGGSASKYSACVGLIVPYDGDSDEMWEKELFHPDTPKSSVTKLVDYGDVIEKGQWVGDKITSVRQPDGSVLNTQYLDLDPFDAEGKPKNNWVKVFEYVDSGNNVVNWSGRVSTWRIDEAKKVYGKWLSVRSVKAP